MAIPVQHKRSATPGAVPTTAALLAGQIALNTYDGRAFFKKSVSGTESIVELATTAAMAATYLPLSGGTIAGDLSVTGAITGPGGYTLFGRQANDVEGGEIRLQKPTTGSTLAGDLVIDLCGNSLRIFEGGSPFRGAYLDIGTCASQSALLHANNYGSYALPLAGGVLTGALTFCADAWNYSADGKNRLWFQTNGRSFYGSQDGHQFNTSSNALAGFLSDAGALMIAGNSMQIMTASTPVNGTTAGNAGEIRWDASYIYVCTSANTWKRAALSSF